MHNDGIDPESKRKIYGILEVFFPHAQIYLFGSRATGKFREFSDIDLAIALPGAPRLKVEEAKDVIDALRIPYKVDIIDLYHTNNRLRETILKEGILWKH